MRVSGDCEMVVEWRDSQKTLPNRMLSWFDSCQNHYAFEHLFHGTFLEVAGVAYVVLATPTRVPELRLEQRHSGVSVC